MSHYKQTWYPMVPKKNYSKNINSELSSAVPIICIVILDQKFHPIQCWWFFDIASNLWKYHFFVQKLWKSLQILKGCKYATRLHNDMCDTAFESLDVIVFDMIIFGTVVGVANLWKVVLIWCQKGANLCFANLPFLC